MSSSRRQSSAMHESTTRSAKRRKCAPSTSSPVDALDLLIDMKNWQLRQVIQVALNNGNVTESIRQVHDQLSRKAPLQKQSGLVAVDSAPVKDEVIESIEKSPMPLRNSTTVPAPQDLPEPTTNGNLPTPRSSHDPFQKEVQHPPAVSNSIITH